MAGKYGVNAEGKTEERSYNLKLLEMATNENTSLQKSATAQLLMASVISFLFAVLGAVFLILEPSEILSTFLNSMTGLLCGGILLLSIQSLISDLSSKGVDAKKIKYDSKISDNVILLSLENFQDKGCIGSVTKIIKERSKIFRTWRVWCSVWTIMLTICLMVLIYSNIFIDRFASDGVSTSISVEYILIGSGIVADDDITAPLNVIFNEIMEENIKLRFFGCGNRFTIVRIVLEKSEKLNIERILHGLKPKNPRDPEHIHDIFDPELL
ncbi:17082_t:CDS:2 [Acaulospora morrowiae]|uniref:17082_t:CDS:1 n=1 Tax=Acaulospora morrowiae TaxID=94023 RepID=A0A9N9GT27_9GLOM|nr:17082_t:CDS:2 [Acaulospora morrowiae]